MLEREPGGNGDAARIARKHLRIQVVERRAWNREAMYRGAGESDRSHVVDRTADILRVVEDVVEAAGELEPAPFANRHILRNRSVDIVDRFHAHGVAARGGKSALGSGHIAGMKPINNIDASIAKNVAI